jgi:uncharacterized protein (DUF1697 family)
MKELKKCFENLGFENVMTYINSGNVLFEAENPGEKKFEEAIEKHFGFHVSTRIVSGDVIANICDNTPSKWKNNENLKTDVLFLWENIDTPDILKEIKQNPNVDILIYVP